MAILALRTIRDWSLEQTAMASLPTVETIGSWNRRKDETQVFLQHCGLNSDLIIG